MKHLLFFISYFILSKLAAQELFFNKPAAFQNLPSVETYQILQDSKGVIWITTDGGLCRYNGNALTVFTVKDGISENVVLKGYEDKKGRIWFTTLSGYFFYYYNNRFYPIAANEELKKNCLARPLTSFFIGENDTLFCSTKEVSGLIKIPPEGNYKTIIHTLKPYEKYNIFCYFNKSNNNEVVYGKGECGLNTISDGTYNGIVNCYGKRFDLKYTRKNLAYHQDKAYADRQGNMYFEFGFNLLVIRKSTATIESYDIPYPILSIYQDKDSDLWIGTIKGGGFLYKHSDLNSKPIHFLNDFTISSILLDRERSVWVTTTEKGIFKSNSKDILLLNEKGVQFQKSDDQLNITCLKKKVITAYKNDSLYTDNTFSKSLPPLIEFKSSFIGKNYSYFNTNSHIYYRLKKDTTSLTPIVFLHVNEMLKLGGDTICAINPGTIYMIFKDQVINVVDPPFSIRYTAQLKDKTILLGSRSNDGIFEFKNNTFIPYLHQFHQLKTRINCIVQDSTGNLWIATNEHGLYCYGQNKKLYAYNSLLPGKLNSLTLDRNSNLWTATNNELVKINYSKGLEHPLICTFNQGNGIPNFQLEKITEFNGKIWCSTHDQLFYFESDKLTLNKVPPLVYISGILINDKPFNNTGIKLRLNYNENNIRIQSLLIANKNTEQKQFLYMLSGYDKNWHSSSLGDVQYANLPYGNYTYIIYGLNNDAIKSAKPATISFEIEKPFWLTWWFIFMEAAFIFTAIYCYFRYWKTKIEKRERERASVNQEISEFKMTALRSQMNPHFIFNAIGSIQHYILKNEIRQSYDYLSKFSMLIRNILNNSRQEYISLTQEINTLRLYIELEQIRFTVPFEFVIEIDEDLDMEMDIPTMLIQPYVENSIWHGLMPKESGGKLKLIFKKTDEGMFVIIRDNGIGRKVTEPSKHISRGMSITEQRINILTTTNKKKFVTTIIDLKDDNGNSSGTEINLTIPFDNL
jgi:ligand-binding sensor domain-containing protein